MKLIQFLLLQSKTINQTNQKQLLRPRSMKFKKILTYFQNNLKHYLLSRLYLVSFWNLIWYLSKSRWFFSLSTSYPIVIIKNILLNSVIYCVDVHIWRDRCNMFHICEQINDPCNTNVFVSFYFLQFNYKSGRVSWESGSVRSSTETVCAAELS